MVSRTRNVPRRTAHRARHDAANFLAPRAGFPDRVTAELPAHISPTIFSFPVAITSLVIITTSTNSTSDTYTISAIISTSTAGITYMTKNCELSAPLFCDSNQCPPGGPDCKQH